jgi:hypothetical protein
VDLPIRGRGTVVLLTRHFSGPAFAGIDYSVGYAVAAVELIEQVGLRVVASLTGTGDASFGSIVELCWVDRNGDPTPAFRVVES